MNLDEQMKLLISQLYKFKPPLDEDIKALAKIIEEDTSEQNSPTDLQ